MLRIFSQIAAHLAVGGVEFPFGDAHILAAAHHVVPVVLQPLFGFDRFGHQHQPRGVLVEAVYDEELVGGILGLKILAHNAVGGTLLDLVGAHGEQSVPFVYDDDVIVFVHQLQAPVVEHHEGAGEIDFHLVAGLQGEVKLLLHLPVDHHLAIFEHLFHGGALLVGHRGDEKGHQLGGSLWGIGAHHIGCEPALLSARFCGKSLHIKLLFLFSTRCAAGLGVLERMIRPDGMFGIDNKSGQKEAEVSRVTGDGEVEFVSKLMHCSFRIACDVTNPLVGELGCSRVFAPQKGANAETVELMEEYMKHYADIVEESVEGLSKSAQLIDCGYEKTDVDTEPVGENETGKFDRYTLGAGAAGGLGYAFLMFLGGKLMPGIDIVLSEIGLEADVEWADTVITGEGRIDAQTMMGKTPLGVAKLAKKHGKYVIAIGGCLGDGAENCVKEGLFNECYAVNNVLGIDDSDSEQVRTAMKPENAAANLTTCAAKITELKEQMSARVCRPALLR